MWLAGRFIGELECTEQFGCRPSSLARLDTDRLAKPRGHHETFLGHVRLQLGLKEEMHRTHRMWHLTVVADPADSDPIALIP